MRTLQLHEDGTRQLFEDDGGVFVPVPAPVPLDEAKRLKRAELAFAALRASTAGFAFAGNTYASDVHAQHRIAAAGLMAMRRESNFPLEWTLADDSSVTLGAAEMLDLGVALSEHLNAVQATARELHARAQAATTVQEVQAVVWP